MRMTGNVMYVMAVVAGVLQAQQITILDIDVENTVQYVGDVADSTKLATVPTSTLPAATRAFTDTIVIGDIVAVNGKPAKGTWSSRQYRMAFNPSPQPGFAIADVSQVTISECKWEILNAEGAFIGRFMDGGFFPHAISGGTGAFLGVRGEMRGGVHPDPIPTRVASMLEDPGYRRVNGGGRTRVRHSLVPLFVPAVDPAGIWHADFSPVSAVSPARPGEILILRAMNLGPTTPDLSPGQPFPTGTMHIVNAPVEVSIGGQPAEVLNQVGWPGAAGIYRVDVRVPAGVATNVAPLQLTAAWIRAAEITLPMK
ncbi:MAG TPA: hypothetical protein VFB63_10965 [Bryobacteraceae bacterium]|jgi:hypothetical protein|nr:hypothetical protein [Bryobacteraceae bacterium]